MNYDDKLFSDVVGNEELSEEFRNATLELWQNGIIHAEWNEEKNATELWLTDLAEQMFGEDVYDIYLQHSESDDLDEQMLLDRIDPNGERYEQ